MGEKTPISSKSFKDLMASMDLEAKESVLRDKHTKHTKKKEKPDPGYYDINTNVNTQKLLKKVDSKAKEADRLDTKKRERAKVALKRIEAARSRGFRPIDPGYYDDHGHGKIQKP